MAETSTFDVLVVGAGPAGIAAACTAAECGVSVGLVEEGFSEGGQIWRGEQPAPKTSQAASWFSRLSESNVQRRPCTRITAVLDETTLLAVSPAGPTALHYRRLVLATGARELFVPFPGWTLPNVMGAGGLQALVKGGLPVKDKEVLVAGSGPLLLAVADHLLEAGAQVSGVIEQAPFGRVMGFGLSLWSEPGKLLQGLGLKWRLRSVPQHFSSHVKSVETIGGRLIVTLLLKDRERRIACDYLACAFGLIPNLELPLLTRCPIDGNGFVKVDDWQATPTSGVYAAGELTGVGGVEKALVEGRIAGYAAAGETQRARGLFGQRNAALDFTRRLARTFELPAHLKTLASDETIVCRCEDISLGALRTNASLREAKLNTRCGMGACQGRTCGSALRFLFGWHEASPRPPVYPMEIGHLAHVVAGTSAQDHTEQMATARSAAD
jgi:NADPH-dependent 2,4-dienoyl-CoA reductase/sulfur reductase-like enzyme